MDINGRYLLDEFVDWVLGVTNGYLYYVNNGILYKVANGVSEVVRHLRELDATGRYYCGHGVWIENGVTPNGRSMYDMAFFSHGIRGVWMYPQTNQHGYDDIQANILIKGKYLLFDKWYNTIRNSGRGLFEVKYANESKIIDASEMVQVNNTTLITSNEIHVIVQSGKSFFVQTYDGHILYNGFTSCIWVDRGDIWNLKVTDGNKQHSYFHGQAPEILDYAQSIIVCENILAILERDSIWYMIDQSGILTECFRNYELRI